MDSIREALEELITQPGPSVPVAPALAPALALAPAPAFPDVRALLSATSAPLFYSHALVSALAPASLSPALKPAYGDVLRALLLDDGVLEVSYVAVGLGRKKVFHVGDLRALLEDPQAERAAWSVVAQTGKLDSVAPLLAYVGRRLDAEAEVQLHSGKVVRFVDVEKKRPGKLRVFLATTVGGLLGISLLR